jgi:hypothetical protein
MTINHEKELQNLAARYTNSKKLLEAVIAEESFAEASFYINDCIKWKHHQKFIKEFDINRLDRIMGRLLEKILEASSVSNTTVSQASATIAIQEANKEQYVLCLKIRGER